MALTDFQLPGMDTPEGQGLLAAAFSLLQARKMPGDRGIGGALGAAGQQYMGTRSQAMEAAQKKKLYDAQIANYTSEADARTAAAAQKKRQQDLLASIFGGAQGISPGAFSPSIDGRGPTMPPSMAGQQSAIGNLSIDDVAKLKAIGGVDLMDAFKWANDPLKLEQGSTYRDRISGKERFMPKVSDGIAPNADGFYGALPGYAQAQATIEGAKANAVESAKAGLDLVDVPQSDGTTVKMPRAQAVAALSGNQPMVNRGAPVSPALQSAIEADAKANGISNPVANFQGNPANGGFMLSSERPAQNAPRLGQTQSPADAGRQKNITEAGGKVNDAWLRTSYEPVITSGQAAQSLIDNSNVARDALAKMGKTGWGTETKAAAASILAGLGIAPENAKMFAANAQIFQAKAMDSLWVKLNAAKGPQTEGDAQRASQTWAALKNTPEANAFILDFAQAQAERDKMKAAFYQNALPIAQSKGDLPEVDREWGKRTPSIFSMPSMQKWAKK